MSTPEGLTNHARAEDVYIGLSCDDDGLWVRYPNPYEPGQTKMLRLPVEEAEALMRMATKCIAGWRKGAK